MKKILFMLGAVLLCLTARAQNEITGFVFDQDGKTPLGFVSVSWLGTPIGTVTDDSGRFSLVYSDKLVTNQLVFSFMGYQKDTLTVDTKNPQAIRVVLRPRNLDEVVITGSDAMNTEIMQGELMTLGDLRKAACCNLSESFETNASVDIAYTDAVSGSKKIRMLGLDGIYSQVMTESMPAVRGLAIRNGLTFIPGTWITSIDVNKGAGSVVNGYESITGQINAELVKPESGERWFGNVYLNGAGRMEFNFHTTQQVSKKWSTALLFHASALETAVDRNGDGFRDLPEGRQLNLIQRWKYKGENVRFQFGVKALYDDRLSGETAFERGQVRGEQQPFGFRSEARRAEVFGKLAFLSKSNDQQSLGIQFSAARHEQDSFWGMREFDAVQNFAMVNAIFDTKTGYITRLEGYRHGIRAGASFMFDQYEQTLNDDRRTREETVPGVFAEHTLKASKKFTLVSGLRFDLHNLHGAFLTPRLHGMYELGTNSILRFSAGRGLRYANPIPEQLAMLQNSRDILWDNDLEPEIAWNVGGSFSQRFFTGGNTPRAGQITLDYYHTHFENQIITDLDSSPYAVRFQNLEGRSFAHSFQAQVEYELLPRLEATAAYKYYDLRAHIADKLREVPFTPRHRFFFNLAYQTADENWKFDATWQWIGEQRIPDTSEKPAEYRMPSRSPSFNLLNAQVTRVLGTKWEVYLGGENLLGYRQENPIASAESPFAPDFEASLIYAPILGRMFYAGVRFSVE